MVIAVLGWGSLIWDPRTLPLSSQWYADGPSLPVEFARQSNDGRLTLVIHGEHPVPVLWAELNVTDLEEARRELGWREGMISQQNQKLSRHVGCWTDGAQSTDAKYPKGHDIALSRWAMDKGLDGVVWTALPPKWNNQNAVAPTAEEAVDYVKGLTGEERDKAITYIANAPAQIRTPYRALFEAEVAEL